VIWTALEGTIVEGVIFCLDGESFILWIERRSFGDGPRSEDAVMF
jgi:hypothetical protein